MLSAVMLAAASVADAVVLSSISANDISFSITGITSTQCTHSDSVTNTLYPAGYASTSSAATGPVVCTNQSAGIVVGVGNLSAEGAILDPPRDGLADVDLDRVVDLGTVSVQGDLSYSFSATYDVALFADGVFEPYAVYSSATQSAGAFLFAFLDLTPVGGHGSNNYDLPVADVEFSKYVCNPLETAAELGNPGFCSPPGLVTDSGTATRSSLAAPAAGLYDASLTFRTIAGADVFVAPEPGSVGLIVLGLAGLGFMRRRKARRATSHTLHCSHISAR